MRAALPERPRGLTRWVPVVAPSTGLRREQLTLNPERSFAPDAVAAALPLDRKLAARGAVADGGVVAPDDGDSSSAVAQQLASVGTDYRERADVPLKLIVFDRRVALLPVNPLDLEAGTYEIDDPAVVSAPSRTPCGP
ncbi:hypothetical protein GCM10029964_011670 [Kibdelosporangium lantanae]